VYKKGYKNLSKSKRDSGGRTALSLLTVPLVYAHLPRFALLLHLELVGLLRVEQSKAVVLAGDVHKFIVHGMGQLLTFSVVVII
jgi:hypothetical protein